jgi:hypothetical protein
MLNFLVETKNEYTSHLTNILTPLIFEGMQSIYKDAIKIATSNDILKIFQSFLKRIPKWNQSMIEQETERIINSSQSYGWLNDLIRATLKANLIVLMYNPSVKNHNKIDPSYYRDIKTTDFIHRVYIECARELWNNPYLLYHNFPPIEIKRNQRDCMNIIKDCIKEAIRKLLPVKHILQIYLGEEMEINNIDDQFEKVMTDVEERNLAKLIKKDLSNDEFKTNNDNQKSLEFKNDTNQPKLEVQEQINTQDKQSDDKSIGTRIMDIIKNKDDSISEPGVLDSSSSQKLNDAKNDLDLETSDLKKSLKKLDENLNNNPKVETFDDKIKKILQKDLATDSDIETSLNYSQEENDNKYQEIFSNSVSIKKGSSNDNETQNTKQKNKFFNKYLQF